MNESTCTPDCLRHSVTMVWATALILSWSASAEDAPDEMIRSLPPISIEATLPDDIRYTPGAASILTDQEIDQLKPYTLHDAFDFVSGVRTIDDDVLGRRSGIGIRGAPARRSRKTLLLEDGVPINASTYLDPSGHYTPPLERLERIDVLKGAGQIVHGPLNNHGIVNFRNMQPTLEPVTQVDVSGGNLDTFKRHVSHRRTEGPFGLVFSYQGFNADGAFDTEETQLDDIFASVSWGVSERHDLGLSFTYARERADGYDENNLTPAQFAANPRSKLALDEGREFNNFSVNYWKIDLTHKFQVTDHFSLSSKFFRTDLDRPRFRTRGTSPRDGGVMEGRDREYRVYGLRTHAELDGIRTFGMDHTFQAGIRYEEHRFDDKRPVGRPGEALDEDNRGNVFAVAGVDGFTRDGRLTEFKAHAISGFFQDAMRIGDWTVTPGIRVETFTQEKEEKFRPGSELADESSDETVVLPGISFLYTGLQDTQVYAGVHRGFAPAIARTTDFPLEAETGINSQIGLRSNLFRGIEFEVAGFYTIIQDTLIKEDFTDAFGDNIFINSADSRSRGVDVDLHMNSRAYIPSPYNLYARVNYNFTEAKFTEGPLDGNRVPEIPLHAGSFTLGLDHKTGWDVSITASLFGHFFADRENTRELDEDVGRVPSRTLISARASYPVPDLPMTLYVQGRNLTDRLFVNDVSDGLRPGPERTIIGGVNVAF